jgi:hypothetical protein
MVIVIPDNCAHVIIHLHLPGTVDTPAQPDDPSDSDDHGPSRDPAGNGHYFRLAPR